MKKSELKKEVKMCEAFIEAFANKLNESNRLLELSHKTTAIQMKNIELLNKQVESLTIKNKALTKIVDMLNKQAETMDKAIERKDKQFLGLRSAYIDEAINKGL